MTVAVQFEDVSKRFTLHHERARTFQEAALNLLRLKRNGGSREEFWALRGVSFTLDRGRTLGVIGRNGSGKSTLLKLLSGTMRPTAGRISAHGRVFGLLELAAGFHPDLSGRDNVFLNGTFLGLSHREMERRLDQIVAFAELEQFIDTPVKHYSSGMYMRLGFAIAVSVDPDILVIDEVLAVGDAAFRQKCFAALADLKARQKTILFVTHDPSAVRRFCDEALWLDHGTVRATGPADAVLREYLAETTSTHGAALSAARRPADPLALAPADAALVAVETVDERGTPERHFESGQRLGVRVRLRAARALDTASVGVAIHRADGLYLNATSTAATGRALRLDAGEGEVVCWLDGLPVGAAEYTVSAALWLDGAPVHRLSQAGRFAIRPPRADQAGLLTMEAQWSGSGAAAVEAPAVRAAAPVAVGAAAATAAAAAPAAAAAAVESNGSPAGTAVEAAPNGRHGGFRPGGPEDQVTGGNAFRFRWRPPPSRLRMGEADDEFLGAGWYAPENWPPCVRWSSSRASVYLTQDEYCASVGITMCRPQHDETVATGRVFVGGRLAGTFEAASPALEPFTFPVEPVDAPQEVEVVVEVDLPLEPAAGGQTDDRRVLGVAVREVWLE